MSAQNDAGFLRMFLLILGALVAFTVIILFAANQIGGGADEAGDDSMRQAAIAERIAPVAKVNIGDDAVAAAPAAAAEPRDGKTVFDAVCMACHATGAAGAPKVGDKAAWEPRVAQGLDTLVTHAINGKGAMPPRGGNPTVSDQEIHNAVEYMLKETGF